MSGGIGIEIEELTDINPVIVVSIPLNEDDILTINATISYNHSSDDRNDIWSAKLSVSTEYDYFSLGAGGSYTKLFNQKNTEISVNGNVFFDTWIAIYPSELRSFVSGGNGLSNSLFTQNTITGNTNYAPVFTEFDDEGRNSYSVGVGFSQILSKRL